MAKFCGLAVADDLALVSARRGARAAPGRLISAERDVLYQRSSRRIGRLAEGGRTCPIEASTMSATAWDSPPI
jgi:hypothetical protein